ncbi:MAG: hypothetical protein CMP10_00745 [Zetaproteobacteria bacterium]|nr:hypothetical protein [Pseudobdellovibrionaceae bacterium]|tara:strand:+ start:250 stop:1404 length:1155 start_codon:yes stop_codon:yes gene_type:complete
MNCPQLNKLTNRSGSNGESLSSQPVKTKIGQHFWQNTDALGQKVLPYLEENLFIPVQDFLQRPSKGFRAELVSVGFKLSTIMQGQESLSPIQLKRQQLCQDLVEWLHGASLIIDDYQDQSPVRRGQACYHDLHGGPQAITAGNWAYFYPLRFIDQMELAPDAKLKLYETYFSTLEWAHLGQSLDISVSIDQVAQDNIAEVVTFAAREKTGALTALALQLGPLVEGLDPRLTDAIRKFGSAFGILLQKFDDIGNTLSSKEPEKRYEDIRALRPSWIWSLVAEHFSADSYREFTDQASQLKQTFPQTETFDTWLQENKVYELAKKVGKQEIKTLTASLDDKNQGPLHHLWQIQQDDSSLPLQGPIVLLKSLCERLEHAYTTSRWPE